MPTYNYTCNKCAREYMEKRLEDQEQIFSHCECGGVFIDKPSGK